MRAFLKKYWGYLFVFLLGAYSGKSDFKNIATTAKAGMGLFENGVEWIDHFISKKYRK